MGVFVAAGRFVIHPTFQGLNLGPNVLERMGMELASRGLEFLFVTSHRGLVRYFRSTNKWQEYAKAAATKGSSRLLYRFKWTGATNGKGTITPQCFDCHKRNFKSCHGKLNFEVVLPPL